MRLNVLHFRSNKFEKSETFLLAIVNKILSFHKLSIKTARVSSPEIFCLLVYISKAIKQISLCRSFFFY